MSGPGNLLLEVLLVLVIIIVILALLGHVDPGVLN